MEQVATPMVLELLDSYKAARAHKDERFDFDVFDFYNFGVPQHRRRVIAGSRSVVARLRRRAANPLRRSLKDVIAKPRGTHTRTYVVRSSARPGPDGRERYQYYGIDEGCRPITGAVHCATAGYPLRWATPHTNTKPVSFTPREMASVQCFPPHYILPTKRSDANRALGNALPPVVMSLMLGGRV